MVNFLFESFLINCFSKHAVQRPENRKLRKLRKFRKLFSGSTWVQISSRSSQEFIFYGSLDSPTSVIAAVMNIPTSDFFRKVALSCAQLSRRVTWRVQRTRRAPKSKHRLFFYLMPALFCTQIIRRIFRPIYMSWDFSVPTSTPLSGSALEAR